MVRRAMTEGEIVAEILAFMGGDAPCEAAFDALALRLFAYQFENNDCFRRFCVNTGRSRRSVATWRDIPPVPITAFKSLTLSCAEPGGAERVFMTSGTTRDGVRGKCYHPTLAVYDRSMTLHFADRFMRDRDRDRIRMGILFPTEDEMPNSSLAHYLALAAREFGAAGSRYLLHEKGLDSARLYDELARAERSGEPYAILGATYGFVHLFDEMARDGRSFALPPGSRALDTGGFKGRAPELAAGEFYARMAGLLGIAREECVNMYGMTELSTQFYDAGDGGGVKTGPHWIRTRVADPLSGADAPPGAAGVLVHCDLANFNSVTTIMTEDVGVAAEGGGFRLLGRADGAQAKGCSMAVEEFLRSARG